MPDRERAAEERVVTILAAQVRGYEKGSRRRWTRRRGRLFNWMWSGLTALYTGTGFKVRCETQLDESQDLQSRDSEVMLMMLTVLTMVVMVVRGELHGCLALDEVLTGVVGWCCVKSVATPVWCATSSMWGCSWATLGSVGVVPPTSSFDIQSARRKHSTHSTHARSISMTSAGQFRASVHMLTAS